MWVRIHRGANEIGGTCLELSCADSRIVLDAGLPLTREAAQVDLLPDVPGLWGPGDGSLLGVFISHTHPDHHGLADLVHDDVPVLLGTRAARMRAAGEFFRPWAPALRITRTLEDAIPVALGPFIVTPLSVDHAEDAFAFLVEAGGRRLLYTGDLRGHGREAHRLEALVAAARRPHAVLMEGTRVGRGPTEGADQLSERDVEERCIELIVAARRGVVALCSAENLDRVESLHRASQRAGRRLVLDFYAAMLWRAAGRSLGAPEDPGAIRVFLPRWQRRRVLEEQAFARLDKVREHRVYPEELRDSPQDFVVACRTSALTELEDLGLLLDGDAIWSMWAGYLDEPSGRETLRVLRRNGMAVHDVHSSGHACVEDLQALARTLEPEVVVPIHTLNPDRYADLFDNVVVRSDGEWWSV